MWLEDALSKMKHAVKDYQMDWQATRFMLDGKMFAMIGENKEKEDIISLKVDPAYGDMLKQQYKDITSGYYLNKLHWISIRLEGSVPDDLMRMLISKSYHLVSQTLTKKRLEELDIS
jgi:predicted DNA-binding protein (MmcQ/YjbR family)